MLHRSLPVVSLLFVLVACVSPAERRAHEESLADDLRPTFLPSSGSEVALPRDVTGSVPPAREEPPSPPVTGPTEAEGLPETSDQEASRSPQAPVVVSAGSIADGERDVSPAVGAPPHADLTGSDLERRDATFELRHGLRAGAPTEGDGRNTMNIATFFDIDGDGRIDYEVWANLGDGGWGTSWFQTEPPRALYGADDEVSVTVEDGAVVLTFPSAYVGDAAELRWSIASEWGPYAAIGTRAMARDYAPDDRSGVVWPEG